MVTGERQSARIRSLYLRTILRQEIGYFDKETTTGEIISRMSGDTFLIQDAMGEKVGKFIQLVASFFGGFVIALIKGWLLTLVLLSSVPPIIISTGIMIIITAKMTSRGQMAYSLAGTVVEQTIGSIRTVASFTGERQAINKYKKSLLKAYRSGVQAGLALGLGSGVFMFLLYCSYAFAVWYGSHSELIQDPEGAFCQYRIQKEHFASFYACRNLAKTQNKKMQMIRMDQKSLWILESLRSLSQGSSGIGNRSRHSFSILFGVPTAINFLEKTTAEPTTPASATLQAVVPQVPLRRLAYLNKPEIPMLIIGAAAAVIHEHSSGAISARLSGDATLVRNLVGDSLALIVQNAATAIVGLVIAFQANWLLALIILVMVPLIGLNGYIQAKFLSEFSADAKVSSELSTV
ncbi:ABC transporter B family member 11 [Camellia lanceoleosa]|uniref:ABC transporter B family member 11 n=1 Tax=Camellia lanceoleosa TaxID=1840588 RepID=A0ACC0FF11_9ERIC|nr:ABC transporter B family member 11 [Camellia lanceoleosa]